MRLSGNRCFRVWGYVTAGLFLALLLGCDLRQPDDYEIGRDLTGGEVAQLAGEAERAFGARNEGLLKVLKMTASEGFEFSMLDGFLYERTFTVVHLDTELEILRQYDAPSVKALEARVGEPGWSLEKSGWEYDRAMLLRRGRRGGSVSFKAGSVWRGKMTGIYERVGDKTRIRHVGHYKRFRPFEGDGGSQ